MEEEVNEIVTDNLKDILKIVIAGFITLDFFSPITFRFIAGLFEEENSIMWTFATFRVIYLSVPLIFLFGFSIYKVNVKNLFNSYDVADFRRQFVALSIVFLLFLIFAFFGIGSFPLKTDTGIAVIKLQLILIVSVFLFLFIYFVFSLRRDKKFGNFTPIVYIFLFSITIGATILFFRLGNGKPNKEHFSTYLDTLYVNPFTKQKNFKDASKYVDSLDSAKESITKLTFEIAMKANLFGADVDNNGTLKRLYSPMSNPLELSSIMSDKVSNNGKIFNQLQDDSKKLDNDVIKISELQEINARANFIDRSLTFSLFQAESSLAQEARHAREAAVSLLRFVQVVELIFLISIIALLWLTIRFFKSFKSLAGETMYLQTTLIIYLLMAVQMVKPIDPRHIDINDPGWPFTQPTWYLPGYIQSIGTISNTTPSIGINTDKTTVIIRERVLQEEITKIKDEVASLRNLLDNKMEELGENVSKIKTEFE
ncbi:hypothetical protein C943_01317 [Mariniradius saccharolyticus AK6]|uniref:Uncharacterized protein n=1 Tax=Mariniradius saccharolyticus AK6 TaxID=1239962 RepID=M7X554_9BACT|nr:hypothetical protein [Mariniradius saccharolyticus]EMS32590.1 hypothetical protein C943_01317 [Mariniradius saccharolyticus AK6]